jgi:protein ImuA
VWIGPAVFPSVWALARHDAEGLIDAPLLDGHLLVDARRTNDRLWAADLALRNPAVACVVADGSSFDSAATRRLQLAAESTGALCLLARHANDLAELSTATTRWLVEPAPTPHHSCARWTVRLLRCKGLRPTTHSNAWTVDIPHAPRDGRVSSILRDGPALPCAAPLEPERRVAPAHTLRFG